MLLSAEKPSFFIENNSCVISVTKRGNFTAITGIMKPLANSRSEVLLCGLLFFPLAAV